MQMDRYFLHLAADLERRVLSLYDGFAFNRGVAAINEFISILSSLYFDAVKDTLYCDRNARRMAAVDVLQQVSCIEVSLK